MPVPHKPSLPKLQQWLQQIVSHPKGAATALQTSTPLWTSVIQQTPHLKRDKRLAIYGDGYFLRLIGCLEVTFSTVNHAVGSDNFQELARAYLVKFPSTHKSVEDIGAHMATFLKTHRLIKKFPFIADVARLEWAAQEAFYSPDLPLLTPHKLATFSNDNGLRVKLILDSSVSLLDLDWPIHELWKADGKWSPARLKKLTKKKNYVLVFRRPELDLRVVQINLKQFHLLKNLQQKKTLGHAFKQANPSPSQLQKWFGNWTEQQIIRDIQ